MYDQDYYIALTVRTYVPTQPLLDGGYKLPDVEELGLV